MPPLRIYMIPMQASRTSTRPLLSKEEEERLRKQLGHYSDEGGHGFFSFKTLTDLPKNIYKDLKIFATGIVPGTFGLGKALFYDAPQGNFKPLKQIGEQMAQSLYEELRHPLRHPLFTFLDLAGLGTLGVGAAAKITGAVGKASLRAEAARRATAEIIRPIAAPSEEFKQGVLRSLRRQATLVERRLREATPKTEHIVPGNLLEPKIELAEPLPPRSPLDLKTKRLLERRVLSIKTSYPIFKARSLRLEGEVSPETILNLKDIHIGQAHLKNIRGNLREIVNERGRTVGYYFQPKQKLVILNEKGDAAILGVTPTRLPFFKELDQLSQDLGTRREQIYQELLAEKQKRLTTNDLANLTGATDTKNFKEGMLASVRAAKQVFMAKAYGAPTPVRGVTQKLIDEIIDEEFANVVKDAELAKEIKHWYGLPKLLVTRQRKLKSPIFKREPVWVVAYEELKPSGASMKKAMDLEKAPKLPFKTIGDFILQPLEVVKKEIPLAAGKKTAVLVTTETPVGYYSRALLPQMLQAALDMQRVRFPHTAILGRRLSMKALTELGVAERKLAQTVNASFAWQKVTATGESGITPDEMRFITDALSKGDSLPDEILGMDERAKLALKSLPLIGKKLPIKASKRVEDLAEIRRQFIKQARKEGKYAGPYRSLDWNLLADFWIDLNNAMRISYLFLKVGYIMNALGTIGLSLIQGAFHPASIARAVVYRNLLPKAARDVILAGMNEGGARVMAQTAQRGALTGISQAMAETWGKVIDKPLRYLSFIHEARKMGFDTPEKIADLTLNKQHVNTLMEVFQRANDNLVDFTRISDVERSILGNIVFFYPWIKGSSRYTLLTLPVNYPAKTLVMGKLAQYGEDEYIKPLGELPSMFMGVFTPHPKEAEEGDTATVINPLAVTFTQAPLEIITSAIESVKGAGRGEGLQTFLSPAAKLTLAAISSAPTGVGQRELGLAPSIKSILESMPQYQLYRRGALEPIGGPSSEKYNENERRWYEYSLKSAWLQYLLGGAGPRTLRLYNVRKD
jgi:hypothetical protein